MVGATENSPSQCSSQPITDKKFTWQQEFIQSSIVDSDALRAIKISPQGKFAVAGESGISIWSLLQHLFERRTLTEKLCIKELSPDQGDKEKGKLYRRGFSRNWYTRKAWLAGCNNANALFCIPCLLFKTSGTDVAWTVSGVTDMKHFSEKKETRVIPDTYGEQGEASHARQS